jgi:hypothetical protein
MTKIDSDISRPKVREIKEIEGPVPVKRRIGRPPKKKNIRVDNFAQRDAKNDIAMPDMLSNLATVSERFSPIMVSDRYPSQVESQV